MTKKEIMTCIKHILIVVTCSTILTLLLFFAFTTPTRIQVNNVVYEDDKQKTMNLIENIAWNVSQSHDYEKGIYDCKNYSRDLIMVLGKEYNLPAYCVQGFVKNNNSFFGWSKHQWVEIIIDRKIIPIEATNGFIIDNQTYSSEYWIMSKGWCF
jgi:hypothetical protein